MLGCDSIALSAGVKKYLYAPNYISSYRNRRGQNYTSMYIVIAFSAFSITLLSPFFCFLKRLVNADQRVSDPKRLAVMER